MPIRPHRPPTARARAAVVTAPIPRLAVALTLSWLSPPPLRAAWQAVSPRVPAPGEIAVRAPGAFTEAGLTYVLDRDLVVDL